MDGLTRETGQPMSIMSELLILCGLEMQTSQSGSALENRIKVDAHYEAKQAAKTSLFMKEHKCPVCIPHVMVFIHSSILGIGRPRGLLYSSTTAS